MSVVKWKEEEDHVVVSSVLNSLSMGGSRMAGFMDASSILGNKTQEECMNRWNNVLKHGQETNITRALYRGKKAKKEREDLEEKVGGVIYDIIENPPRSSKELYAATIDLVGRAFDNLINAHESKDAEIEDKDAQIETLKRERVEESNTLIIENERLKERIQNLETQLAASVEEVVKLLDRNSSLEKEILSFANAFNAARRIMKDEPILDSKKFSVDSRGTVNFEEGDNE